MMLENILQSEECHSLYRRKNRDFITSTVPLKSIAQEEENGWIVAQQSTRTARLVKKKTHDVILEDRVWCLMYRMGFVYLSGMKGANLHINPKDPADPVTQIDVVAIDNEVAIAVECKSAEKPKKRPAFSEELGKHSLCRTRLTQVVGEQYTVSTKRATVLAMFTSNIVLTDQDRARALEANIILFDDTDLVYYEQLVSHLGPAARYQFLSDLLPNRIIDGLRLRVPAVKTKMAGVNCYTFSVSPEYLLKIAFISHRAKGHASDVDKYQRMISKTRLKNIREYITKGGVFPTNIIISLDNNGGRTKFERIKQDSDQESGTLGWLEIRPAYKSAWVIDGQHRLFAYSGHPEAKRSMVSVLAFDGLAASTQAQLFIDINAEQKSVKQSLLQELYSELHWDSADPKTRVRAIISKSVMELGAAMDSPFYDRILRADDKKTETRCISLTSIFSALEKSSLYIAKERQGKVIDYGPLWAGDNMATLKRTVFTLKNWFELISSRSEGWWDLGSASGGGLAMNDPIIACINVLRSVIIHIESKGIKLVHADNHDLFEALRPYGAALGDYFGSLTSDARKGFRDLRGVQGQTTRLRRCQEAIRNSICDFNPPGLVEWIDEEAAETTGTAREFIDSIERLLQDTVIQELRVDLGDKESEWWMEGVPEKIRIDARLRWEQDKGKRGGTEFYLNLIDYRTIIIKNWKTFEHLLAYGKGSKDKCTEWIVFVNERRKVVMHSSSGQHVTLEDLAQLEEYNIWLRRQVSMYNED